MQLGDFQQEREEVAQIREKKMLVLRQNNELAACKSHLQHLQQQAQQENDDGKALHESVLRNEATKQQEHLHFVSRRMRRC